GPEIRDRPARPLPAPPVYRGSHTISTGRGSEFHPKIGPLGMSLYKGSLLWVPQRRVLAVPGRTNTVRPRVERTPVSWEYGGSHYPKSEIFVMTYRAPITDILLALNHGAGLQAAVNAGHYGDFGGDITAAVLEEAGKFAGDVLAPLNKVGDEHGIKLADDKVTTAPGWPDAYQRWIAGGWNAVSGPEAFGGQGLPLAINAACTEIWSASNIAFGLCPLLTLSAIEALDAHGSEELKK